MTDIDEERAFKRGRDVGEEAASAAFKRTRKTRARKAKDPAAPKLKQAIEKELRDAIKGCLADGRRCAARLRLVAKQAASIKNKSLVARAVRAGASLSKQFGALGRFAAGVASVRALIGI